MCKISCSDSDIIVGNKVLVSDVTGDIAGAVIKIAKEAGKITMRYYKTDCNVNIKEDESPVTQADIAANNYIISELEKLTIYIVDGDITDVGDSNKIKARIRIVSEESANEQFSDKDIFFIIDPLDGTKSFIKNSDDFTVNIGVVASGVPVFGVVYAPATDVVYYRQGSRSYRQEGAKVAEKITVTDKNTQSKNLVVVASKAHLSQETKDFVEKLDVKEFVSIGSSLKFCLVAQGAADIYPRFGPTMEWDTAAAHAVLIGANGAVTNPDGTAFTYGKKDYRNGYFIAQ